MAVSHDNTTFGGIQAQFFNLSHTVPATADRVLVVKVALKDNSIVVNVLIWDPPGANESFTFLNADRNGNARSEIWYLPNPTAKAANISFTLSGSARTVVAGSSYVGVDPNTPFRTAAAASNNGNDASPTVDVVALNNEMVVDSLCQVSAGPDTATGDHTERHNDAQVGGGTDTRGASQEKASAGATETMGWTMSDIDNWSISAAPLQEPQAAAGDIEMRGAGRGIGRGLARGIG